MKDKGRVGFVAVYRKIQDHWLWQDKDRFFAWMDILISAQFHDAEKIVHGCLIKVPRGSWFVAQKTLETRWGWSKTKVRHFLNTLTDEGMITTKSTPNGTIITIVKYELYQNPNTSKNTTKNTTEDTTEDTTKGKTEDTHTNHVYQVDKGKHENKSMASFLRKCTFEEDEIERFMQLCEDHKSPFPNVDVENEYFKVAMAKREERESNG